MTTDGALPMRLRGCGLPHNTDRVAPGSTALSVVIGIGGTAASHSPWGHKINKAAEFGCLRTMLDTLCTATHNDTLTCVQRPLLKYVKLLPMNRTLGTPPNDAMRQSIVFKCSERSVCASAPKRVLHLGARCRRKVQAQGAGARCRREGLGPLGGVDV